MLRRFLDWIRSIFWKRDLDHILLREADGSLTRCKVAGVLGICLVVERPDASKELVSWPRTPEREKFEAILRQRSPLFEGANWQGSRDLSDEEISELIESHPDLNDETSSSS